MFNKKPDKALYFAESLFFAKTNLYNSNNALFELDEANKKFEKGKQYTLAEIENGFNKKYEGFQKEDIECLNKKFTYINVGIIGNNKGIITTLLDLIVEGNWKKTCWYTTGVNGKTFVYKFFGSNGFNTELVGNQIYWLETNRLKGNIDEVKETLYKLNLDISKDFESLFSGLKGITIKYQITESILSNKISIRYCYETLNCLGEVKEVELNAGKFKSYVRHLYKIKADKRMAIYQYDNKCATKEKEEYLKHNAGQIGIGFTWYITNKNLKEFTLETHEDSLIRNIFKVKAKTIEEEIGIVLPLIEKCYNDAAWRVVGFPTIRIKQEKELWLNPTRIDFGLEIVGNSDSHKQMYHTISYILLYIINKYDVVGKYSYRTYIEGNTSRVGLEKNY